MATAALRRAMTAFTRPPDPPDAALLRQFADGRCEAAFAALVRRHGPLVLGVCRRVVPDRHLADDAFQAAFVVLARRAGGIDPTRPLGPWLYGVAHRVALRARTMIGRRRKRETLAAGVPEVPHTPPAADDTTAILDEEIARLPDATREAVILCELQGLTRREAAAKLGVAEGTLSSRLAAARKLLAARLRSRGVTLGVALAGAAVLSPELASAAVAAATGATLNSVVVSLADGASAMTLLNKLKLTGVAVLFLFLSAGGVGPWGVNHTAAAPPDKPAPPKASRLLLSFSGKHDGQEHYDSVVSIDPDTGTWKLLAESGHGGRVTADGTTVVFVKENAVHNVATDGSNNPGKLFDDDGYGGPVPSRDGKHIFVSRITDKAGLWKHTTTRYTAAGGDPTPVKLPAGEAVLDVSPDGKTFLTRSRSITPLNVSALYAMEEDGMNRVKLSPDGGFNEPARFSPDGKRVAFVRNAKGGFEVWVVGADGKEGKSIFGGKGVFVEGVCWSPDGERLAVIAADLGDKGLIPIGRSDGNWRVELVPADGKEKGTLPLKADEVRSLRGVDWYTPPKGADPPKREPIKAPVPKAAPPEGVIVLSSFGAEKPIEIVKPDGTTVRVVKPEGWFKPWQVRLTADGKGAICADMYPTVERKLKWWTLHAVRWLDLRADEVKPTTIVEEAYCPTVACTPDGKAVYLSHIDEEALGAAPAKGDKLPFESWRYDPATGKKTRLKLPPDHAVLDVSPDGKTLLTKTAEFGTPKVEVYLTPLDTLKPEKFGDAPLVVLYTPRFSPDGKRVLWAKAPDGPLNPDAMGVFVTDVATKKEVKLNLPPGVGASHLCWSPDGKRIAVHSVETSSNQKGSDVTSRVTVCDVDGGNPSAIVSREPGQPGPGGSTYITGLDWVSATPTEHHKKDEPKAKPPVSEAARAPVPKAKLPEKLDRPPAAAEELRKELAGWDEKYRHGSEEKFAELEKRADEVAKEYDTDYNQARVWFAVAHVAGQSDIGKHAGRVRQYAEKALKLSRDPLDRGRLYSYLASCEEVGRGEFADRRRKAADWLLKGYLELLAQELPDQKPELPGVERFDVGGNGPEAAQARAKHAAQVAAREQAVWVCDQIDRRDTLVLHLRNLYEPHPKVYGHGPDGPDELRKLAEAVLPSAGDVDTLMERVLPGVKPPTREPIKAPVPAVKEETMGLTASVTPEKKEVMLGEPTHFAFTVTNPTDKGWGFDVGGDYRNRLGRPNSFTVQVTGPDGKAVPQPDSGPDLGGLSTGVKLPADGTHTFTLFLPQWATFDKPGEYTISVRRKLSLVPLGLTDDERSKVNPEVATVAASARITVTKADAKKFGDLIDTLGVDLFNPRRSDRATTMLLEIRDERVIPHFVKLGQLPRVEPRYAACEGLKKFKTDDAFTALKALAATTADDLKGSAVNRQLEESSARAVRHAAVHALADCPHPEALPLVWKAAGDENDAVRMTVLHKAFEVKSAEARAIIARLTDDADERVRNEAKRYADLLAKEKK